MSNKLLLDSNIIIYLGKGNLTSDFLKDKQIFCSQIMRLEVLGYTQLANNEEAILTNFFKAVTLVDVTEEVINQAIDLRKKRSISVGDAIIASTAMVMEIPLVTRNVRDFKSLEMEIINPF